MKRIMVLVPIVGLGIIAGGAGGQDAPKGKYKVATYEALQQLAYQAQFKDGDKKAHDKEEKKDDKAPAYDLPRLLAGLNQLGKDGWEAVIEAERGVVLRKGLPGEIWEYRVLRTPDSTLNGKSDDNEVLELALDGLAAQGWQLCLGRLADYNNLVFKRSRQMPPTINVDAKSIGPVPSVLVPPLTEPKKK